MGPGGYAPSHMISPVAATMAARIMAGRLFLGFDCSTQGLKATAVDDSLRAVAHFGVNYSHDLPHYRTVHGVHMLPGHVVTQPTAMFLEAFDLLLAGMRKAGFPFSAVAAMSGSGQQHGSAYWKRGAEAKLRALSPEASFKDGLADAFAVADSPIWMDSSTSAQCTALERAVGGAGRLAAITGSRAYERFTLHHIAKLADARPDVYADTERISLISNLMTSLCIGQYAPIDMSDGSGMNLLDITTKRWSEDVLAAVPHCTRLPDRLGTPVPSHTIVGHASTYLQRRWGFAPDCHVVAWSGDNPCSLAGLGVQGDTDVAISLGTSDTCFGITNSPRPGPHGHIFVNPVDPTSYMAMLCYKNGSVAREEVRDRVAGGDWDRFNRLVATTPPGNAGRIGFYFHLPEITPTTRHAGVRRYVDGAPVVGFDDPGADARAVVEGQFLSMRLAGEGLGLTSPTRLLVTGGASVNPAIVQVLADVFGLPVYRVSQPDSASLGAAYRAVHGWAQQQARGTGSGAGVEGDAMIVPFASILRDGVGAAEKGGVATAVTLVATPNAAATDVYTRVTLPAYARAQADMLRRDGEAGDAASSTGFSPMT